MANAPKLVLIHGFTQSRRCWAPFDRLLADVFDVHSVDAPGHGEAGYERLDITGGAAALVARGGPGAYLGYSMGGRFALRLALDFPDQVHALILISANPGLRDAREREARLRSDQALAERIEKVGVQTFVDEWLSGPLFASLRRPDAHVEARCEDNTAAGLAYSLRLAGTGTQEPLWERLHELTMPVLLVTGALDRKFTEIAAEMKEAIGDNAEHVVIEDAGHTAHLERPGTVVQAILSWWSGDAATARTAR